MITETDERVRADFKEWSGGFPPDSTEQIWVYALMARRADVPEDRVIQCLTQWLVEQQ